MAADSVCVDDEKSVVLATAVVVVVGEVVFGVPLITHETSTSSPACPWIGGAVCVVFSRVGKRAVLVVCRQNCFNIAVTVSCFLRGDGWMVTCKEGAVSPPSLVVAACTVHPLILYRNH
ncbi:hypothetical protein E2C01_024159 [Portunus trituberculatus]|uniref:Uncharacterized protein n=1 Tax=Portunus trituberculatus TaxID=210409 RepID=A0A5B7EBV0_PORTR|nr:hypothetical protein [Portunus trituberculatus]